MCPALVGKVKTTGWKEPGLKQGMTHRMTSIEEFMDAHINHLSTRNNKPATHFSPPSPSCQDQTWFSSLRLTVVGRCLFHSDDAASKAAKLPSGHPSCQHYQTPLSTSGVVFNIGDNNFGEIFPKEHVEFIDRLESARKWPAENYDGNGDDRSKTQKN